MIEQLFGSKTRVKLLQLFYSNPNRPFYVREITRKIEEQINSVRRELANLLSAGIIVSDNTNNRLYYEVNQSYEFYKPFVAIFGGKANASSAAQTTSLKKKTTVAPDGEQFASLGRVDAVVYTGQFTRDESSGIDILVIGDVTQSAMAKFVADLETKEKKELRYTIMPQQEFSYRRQIKDRFITTLLDCKKQVVFDRNSLLI